jgi:hypothetical protein
MKILRPEEVTKFPDVRELTPQELAEAYALARKAFTAEDLQRFTELDEGISFDEILASLERRQRKAESGSP